MPTIKRRRRKQILGLSASQHWALKYGDEMLPVADPDPWPDEATARQCWRRHREILMSEMLPGHPPMGLLRYELESFESSAAILALHLDRQSLKIAVNEFESAASFHRRHGRDELAAEFERRAARVRQVIAEGAA